MKKSLQLLNLFTKHIAKPAKEIAKELSQNQKDRHKKAHNKALSEKKRRIKGIRPKNKRDDTATLGQYDLTFYEIPQEEASNHPQRDVKNRGDEISEKIAAIKDIQDISEIVDMIFEGVSLGQYDTETRILISAIIGLLHKETSDKESKSVTGIYKILSGAADVDMMDTLFDYKSSFDAEDERPIYKIQYSTVRRVAGKNFEEIISSAKELITMFVDPQKIFPKTANQQTKVSYTEEAEFAIEPEEEENIPSLKEKMPENISSELDTLIQRNKMANPLKIKEFLDRDIVGQEEAKKTLSVTLANQITAYNNGIDTPRGVTLIIGPTGSGKTFLTQKLAEYSDLPIAIVDASQITADGYRGLDKSAPVKELFTNNPEQKAKYGIVILDEIDKTIQKSFHSDRYYGNAAQAMWLGMFDGTPLRNDTGGRLGFLGIKDEVYPTKNLLFILTGTFEAMEISEKQNKTIGFSTSENTEDKDIRERLLDYGLIPELVGRITNIVFTQALDAEGITDAILDKENSFMKQYKHILDLYGKRLVIDRQYVYDVVCSSLKNGLGVRGAKNILDEELKCLIFRSFSNNSSDIILKKENTDEPRF